MEREGVRSTLDADLQHLLRSREVIAVDSSADVLDQIQRTSERDMAIGNLEGESERLPEVRAAIRRIHLGTFGICIYCNEEISIKRLAALPWTASCLEALALQKALTARRHLTIYRYWLMPSLSQNGFTTGRGANRLNRS
jgi:DnaK suppressor protein